MEIKQPYLFDGAGHSTLFKEAGSIVVRDGSTETTTLHGFNSHDPGTHMATVSESSLCRSMEKSMEPNSIDVSLKKEQSIIDSSDSIPKVEEFERLQEPGEEMISQGNDGPMIMQFAANENPPVLNEEFLLPLPVHMYSRRKKGKKACPIVSEKDSHDVQSTVPKENVSSHGELARSLCHPHAAQSSVLNETIKEGPARCREKQTSCKEHENLHQPKLEKSKCVSSPEKKRRWCVVTAADNNCKTNGPSELGVAVPVSSGSSEYAAVKAGLQAHTATLIEKVRFKDVLKQRDGLRQYLDCSDHSSKFLVLSEGCVLPLCGHNIFWPDNLIGENIRQKLNEASGFRSW